MSYWFFRTLFKQIRQICIANVSIIRVTVTEELRYLRRRILHVFPRAILATACYFAHLKIFTLVVWMFLFELCTSNETNTWKQLVTIETNNSRQRVHFYLLRTSFYVRRQIIDKPNTRLWAIVIAQRRERKNERRTAVKYPVVIDSLPECAYSSGEQEPVITVTSVEWRPREEQTVPQATMG